MVRVDYEVREPIMLSANLTTPDGAMAALALAVHQGPGPASFAWDGRLAGVPVADGTYHLVLTGREGNVLAPGRWGPSVVQDVAVDTSSPRLRLDLRPAMGSPDLISGALPLPWIADDVSDVAKVAAYVIRPDGTLKQPAGAEARLAEDMLSISGVRSDMLRLVVVGIDRAGNVEGFGCEPGGLCAWPWEAHDDPFLAAAEAKAAAGEVTEVAVDLVPPMIRALDIQPTHHMVRPGGQVTAGLSARDIGSGLASVGIQVGAERSAALGRGAQKGEWTDYAYSGTDVTQGLADGVYSLQIVANDVATNEFESPSFELVVDSVPPRLGPPRALPPDGAAAKTGDAVRIEIPVHDNPAVTSPIARAWVDVQGVSARDRLTLHEVE
ncbi:MAG: hypothetical protein ACRDHY_18320, partial [Anaerolineales bacterium]